MSGVSAECWKEITYNGETTTELVNTSYYQATPASWEVGTSGASDALLNAIALNDLAAAQAAAAGVTTQTETTETDTVATETPATDTVTTETPATDTVATGTLATDYVDPNAGYDTGAGDGVVIWE